MAKKLDGDSEKKEFGTFKEMAGTLAITKMLDDFEFNDKELEEIAEVANTVDSVVKIWNHDMVRNRFKGTFGEFLARVLKIRQRLTGK